MNPLIEARQKELTELCRRYGVKRLEIFGSAASDDFDPHTSDLDFLVVFDPDAPTRPADRFFGLRESLEALFGRRVDLLELSAIKNPYFLQEIESARSLLYAA
jgi:hypothetical protein